MLAAACGPGSADHDGIDGDAADGDASPGGATDLFADPIGTDAPAWPEVDHALAPTPLWGGATGAKPTNAWWQNLVLGEGQQPVMVLPYLVKALPDRLSVCLPGQVATDNFVLSTFLDNLSLGAAEPLEGRQLAGFDALSATMVWTAAGGSMRAPLVRGMAYATMRYAGLTPRLTTQHAIVSVNGQAGDPGSGMRFDVRLNNGQRWLVYTSTPLTLTRAGDALVAATPFTGDLRVAFVPDDAAVAVLDAHAAATLVGGEVAATAQGDSARLTMTWKAEGGAPLVYTMPHHRAVLDAPTLTSLAVPSIRGRLVAASDPAWTLVEPLPTITWQAPRAIPEARRADLAAALTSDAVTFRPTAGDPYFFGKQVAAMGRLALIADELGDTASAGLVRGAMADALTPWLAPAGGKLVYDRTWGGLVQSGTQDDPGAAFGGGYYNDHHFHYGYFLYAAAALAKADPAWATANDDAVRQLARDIANPSAADSTYARFRHMDWYEGHSWAAGLFEFADSRNQESTSEAVNAWYGLSLYGLAVGDARLRDLGRLLLASELRTARTYWQITSGSDIYPATYAARKVVGVLWATKVDHATFFGANLEFIHVIQMLPFSPISEELLPRAWMLEAFPLLAQALTRPEPRIDEGWRSLVIAAQAVVDPVAAWTAAQGLARHDDGLSRTALLYWIATRP